MPDVNPHPFDGKNGVGRSEKYIRNEKKKKKNNRENECNKGKLEKIEKATQKGVDIESARGFLLRMAKLLPKATIMAAKCI